MGTNAMADFEQPATYGAHPLSRHFFFFLQDYKFTLWNAKKKKLPTEL